jgi:IS30 family transposase
MSYAHLSIIERSKLEILHKQGQSSRAIAKELGRHPSTICRELDRVADRSPIRQNKLKTLMRSVVRLLSLHVNGQAPWLFHWRKSFR